MPVDMYRAARAWLLANDPDAPRMFEWSSNGTRPPKTAEDMACEVIWIILCAGRSAQAARTIEGKVFRAIRAGEPVVTAFGYRAKADAIERAWRERAADFKTLRDTLSTGDVVQLLEWCRRIPFVGDVTKYQLAKNFGAALCKPDIWLARICGFPDRPAVPSEVRFKACMALCESLAWATGDSIPVVDSVLWLACNKGVLVTDCNAAAVALNTAPGFQRSIY
ncbi:hypothetical protein [Burkholderia cepacia]|uniref:hypothetical protein n=1 Tax=Burkholderia cepacia TaxID=292 RepID=UPI002AB6ED45|nr:hypothetical protein [Burkholderia cepacia]